MKRWLLRFSVLATALSLASAASAQVNLSWNDCGSFGALDKTDLCTSNTGLAGTLYVSFISPNAPRCVAAECYLDMIESVPTQSAYWQLDNINTAGCRAAALAWSAEFLAEPFNFSHFWAGGASGGGGALYHGFNPFNFGPNTQRIKGVFALSGEQAMAAGDEIYGFKINLTRTKTTGAGSCAGCANTACIVLNRVTVNQPALVGDFDLTGPAPGGRDFVTWQGGAGADCNVVPAQNRTWGQVKALYR